MKPKKLIILLFPIILYLLFSYETCIETKPNPGTSQNLHIDIQPITQDADFWACGHACLAMVAKYLNSNTILTYSFLKNLRPYHMNNIEVAAVANFYLYNVATFYTYSTNNLLDTGYANFGGVIIERLAKNTLPMVGVRIPNSTINHMVVAHGAKNARKEDGVYVSDNIELYDPANITVAPYGHQRLPLGSFKAEWLKPFANANGFLGLVYYEKSGTQMNFNEIADGYKEFLRNNGTYYGGPASYIPEGSEFVRISFPIGTDQLDLGQQTNIEWESNGLSGNIKLELLKGDTYWGTIATNLPIQQGSSNWIVGQYQDGTATVGDDYKIKITMMDGSDYDTSNVDFSIVVPPSVTVISPNNGDEDWTVGESHDITWTSTGAIEFVKIEYSTNNGSSWNLVIEQTSNNGIFAWSIPNTPSNNCLIRVSRYSDANTNDISNATFTIAVPITVTRPNGGENWTAGSSYYINWNATGTIANVKIEYSTNNGSSWNNVVASTVNSGSHPWIIPNTPSTTCKVRVSNAANPETNDISNATFIISAGGTSWKYNSPSRPKILPEAIWAAATGGGTWMSEVQVTDLSGGAQVSVYYSTAAGRRGPFVLWNNSSGAFRSQKYSNILQTIDGLDSGTFTYYGTVGAVEFITQDAAVLQVMARTLNGNYSKTLSGLSLHDANTADTSRVMIVPNFTSNSAYRSTCGLYNPSANVVTVELKLLDAANTQIGTTIPKTLNGYGFTAFNPFNDAGRSYPTYSYDNVILKVQPTSGTGKVLCFGASANNVTNDPAAHIAVQNGGGYDNGPSGLQILPEAIWAAAPGYRRCRSMM